jgi:hypothetical protein
MRVIAVVATLCGALLAGCGDDGSRQGPRSGGVRPAVAGTTASLANCGEWKRATPKQRRVTVEDLRGQLTAQDDRTARSVLSDERAYEVFQHACKQSYADGLRLYKLYVKAAAFEPLRKQ